jgi:hypothetical protein
MRIPAIPLIELEQRAALGPLADRPHRVAGGNLLPVKDAKVGLPDPVVALPALPVIRVQAVTAQLVENALARALRADALELDRDARPAVLFPFVAFAFDV